MSDSILRVTPSPLPQVLTGAIVAIQAVHWALRQDHLPGLDGMACVDCGAPATVYEHRDYGRPLDVEPVCRQCNAKRGKAKPAENDDPMTPIEIEGTGYVLSKFGIAPISFQAVDFFPIKRRPKRRAAMSY